MDNSRRSVNHRVNFYTSLKENLETVQFPAVVKKDRFISYLEFFSCTGLLYQLHNSPFLSLTCHRQAVAYCQHLVTFSLLSCLDLSFSFSLDNFCAFLRKNYAVYILSSLTSTVLPHFSKEKLCMFSQRRESVFFSLSTVWFRDAYMLSVTESVKKLLQNLFV